MVKCPGQDQRFWKPEDIFEVECPQCGGSVEFFKDEPKLKCRQCGQPVINPRIDLGCAEWCQYAEHCVGVSVAKLSMLRNRLVDEMKSVFGGDTRRIEHALSVLDYAEQIQAVEGGDPLVVKAAAILHDIGIPEAERKHGSAAATYQELEGPPIAKEILQKHDIGSDVVEHVCRIIAHHHSAKDTDTIEFRIVWDADRLVNIPVEHGGLDRQQLGFLITKVFKTATGRDIAGRELVGISGNGQP